MDGQLPNAPSNWVQSREPLRATLTRTIASALLVAIGIGLGSGNFRRIPMVFVLALWPALGGHFVELWYLNVLRFQLQGNRFAQILSRMITWLVGGVILALAMDLTSRALGQPMPVRWRWWLVGGPVFLALELLVHLALRLRGRPNFYTGDA